MTGDRNNAVQTYLISRGCSPHVVRNGLAGLLEQWAAIVMHAERGRDTSLDEWLNDMDLRDILAGALAAANLRERGAAAARLDDADQRFMTITEPSPSLWGMLFGPDCAKVAILVEGGRLGSSTPKYQMILLSSVRIIDIV